MQQSEEGGKNEWRDVPKIGSRSNKSIRGKNVGKGEKEKKMNWVW